MSHIGPSSYGAPQQQPRQMGQKSASANSAQASQEINQEASQPHSATQPNSSLSSQGNPAVSNANPVGNLAPMSPSEWAQLLRNLLKMPKDILQWLTLLNENSPKELQALLQLLSQTDLEVPLDQLGQHLQKQLQQAQESLIKLNQSQVSLLNELSGESPATLLKQLSSWSQEMNSHPLAVLKTSISLYLPFYPLQAPQNFELYREEKTGEGSGGSQTSENQLSLYIDTQSLGHWKANIVTQAGNMGQVVAQYEPQAKAHLAAVQAQIETLNPPANWQWTWLAQKASLSQGTQPLHAKPERTPQKKNPDAQTARVGMFAHPQISLQAVHMAYLLIRAVLEVDTSVTKQMQRETL